MENIFTDEYFMKRALNEAEIAFEKGEIPVVAVIVVANKIIARSHNLINHAKNGREINPIPH
jgi:tRNA(adenine34) deaminase